MTELLIADVRMPGRAQPADIAIADGRIAAITTAGTGGSAGARIDGGGRLVLPGLVNGHVHLDKTLVGLPWVPHLPGPSVAERIGAERQLRSELPLPMPERAAALLDRLIAFGTTALRCHVDVDAEIGTGGLEALLRLRERYRDRVAIEFVAFPQSGVLREPGAADLLADALELGAEVIGGLDPAGIDEDVEGQLEIVFGLAERYDRAVDIHLHDSGTLGCFELRRIAARTLATGLGGRVAVSHAFALGQVDEREFGRTAEALAEAGVAIMTNGPGSDTLPPVRRLLAAGVRVFAGSDNIRDAWSPFGNGDMLERARMIGYRADFRSDEDLAVAFDLVSAAPRAALGMEPVALEVGSPADLVLVEAETLAEAVASFPNPRLVLRAGQVVAGAA